MQFRVQLFLHHSADRKSHNDVTSSILYEKVPTRFNVEGESCQEIGLAYYKIYPSHPVVVCATVQSENYC